MAENLTALFDKIADETRPVCSIDLTDLSDLARDEIAPFRATWAALGEPRRFELVTTLVEQAEANIHLNFHAVLRTVLDDPDARVRRAAIEGLWEYEKTNLIPSLIAILEGDPAVDVRAAAAISLGRYMLLGALGEITDEAARAAEEALHMVWYRSGETVEVRRRALESLAYGSMPELHALIQNAYYDDNELMRQSAVFAMGRSTDRRWARLVLAELSSPEPPMRFEAAVAAGEMALREAVQPLIRRLEDPDGGVREAATAALGKIGGPTAKRVLKNLAAGSDEALAQAAEDALDELNFGGERFDNILLEVDGEQGAPQAGVRAEAEDEDDDAEAEDLEEDDLGDGFGDGDIFEDDSLFYEENEDGLDDEDDEWADEDLDEDDLDEDDLDEDDLDEDDLDEEDWS